MTWTSARSYMFDSESMTTPVSPHEHIDRRQWLVEDGQIGR
jgi:hypothetical protein